MKEKKEMDLRVGQQGTYVIKSLIS